MGTRIETIEDVLGKRKSILLQKINQGRLLGVDISKFQERIDEVAILEKAIKESQMEPKQETAPTTPKPFDIDRCLNEDQGRCIYEGNESFLTSRLVSKNDEYSILTKEGYFIAVFLKELQNIPRRKERWFNFAIQKGTIICMSSYGHTTKQEALGCRDTKRYTYIGDPICISVEEE